jgi:hypothetical protein
VRTGLDCRHDQAPGSSVGAELVGDHASWRAALLLQQAPQQAFRRFGIAPRLDDFVEGVSVLVNGSSEPIRLASDRDHDLVEMPDVMAARRLAPEAASVHRPELPPHHRTVSQETTMPRSSSISSTSRRLSGNRKYNQTAWAMI